MAADEDEFVDEEVEFEVEEEPVEADIDPEDIDEELVDDADEDAFALDDDALVEPLEEEDDVDDRGPRPAVVVPPGDEDDDDLEMVNEDDVEADLDTILKDRLSSADADGESDEDDEPELDDRGQPTERLAPRRDDERLCNHCFLLVRQGAPNCPMGDDDCPLFP